MKLLLTSAGITNKSIAKALFELVGKKPKETSLVFIPTAANAEAGDKAWLIDDLAKLRSLNFKSVEIADISSADKNIWQPKIKAADILYFEGGNTFYLMSWLKKSGLAALLPKLLKNKVYVGASAGSMVTNKNIYLNISQVLYGEDLDKKKDMSGLGLVDFCFLPHLDSPYFKKVRKNHIIETTKSLPGKIYALDDNSALKITDKKIEVISEYK
jgi:dipeptidase E